MTRLTVNAADVVVGDSVAGVGKVTDVYSDGEAVRICTNWHNVPDAVLSADHVVYVDREGAA